jgi:hypothetical protein
MFVLFDKIKTFFTNLLAVFIILVGAQIVFFQSPLKAMEYEQNYIPFQDGSSEKKQLNAFGTKILKNLDSFPIPNDHSPDKLKKIFTSAKLLQSCTKELKHKAYKHINKSKIKNNVLEETYFALNHYFLVSTTNKKSYKIAYKIDIFTSDQSDPISQLFHNTLNDNDTKKNAQRYLDKLNEEFLKGIDFEKYISKLEKTISTPTLLINLDMNIYKKKLQHLITKIKHSSQLSDNDAQRYIAQLKQLLENYVEQMNFHTSNQNNFNQKLFSDLASKTFDSLKKELKTVKKGFTTHINKHSKIEKAFKIGIIIGTICICYILLELFVISPSQENYYSECV